MNIKWVCKICGALGTVVPLLRVLNANELIELIRKDHSNCKVGFAQNTTFYTLDISDDTIFRNCLDSKSVRVTYGTQEITVFILHIQ